MPNAQATVCVAVGARVDVTARGDWSDPQSDAPGVARAVVDATGASLAFHVDALAPGYAQVRTQTRSPAGAGRPASLWTLRMYVR